MEQIFNEDGSPIDINKVEFLSSQGSEYTVYKYLNYVIKIYKKDYKFSHLSLEDLNILKNILTKRILMPSGTLWNVYGELIGYKMPFVSSEKRREYDNTCNFFKELEVLKEDLDLLCSHSVILRDINLPNTIYNGHMYLIDPGNYLIDELDKIIFNVNITDPLIIEKLSRIVMEGDYSRVKELIDSLQPEERQNILKSWNYTKINQLIDMLLFSKKSGIDSFKYRQIVQFIMKEREKHGFIYNLDVLKMYFRNDASISEATTDFVKNYIKDDPKEKELFLSLYK